MFVNKSKAELSTKPCTHYCICTLISYKSSKLASNTIETGGLL